METVACCCCRSPARFGLVVAVVKSGRQEISASTHNTTRAAYHALT